MANYRTCIFCNQNDSPPSREDVLANWIAREFPEANWDIKRFQYDILNEVKSERKYKKTDGSLGMVSCKPCTRCNNGWMSDLEEAAKPILVPLMHGAQSVLTPDDCLVIVRWFIKTAIMYEYLSGPERDPYRYFTWEERHALMQSLSVPEPTLVFAGRYVGSKDITTREMRLPLAVKRRDDNRTTPVDVYTATFAIKQLALQIFSIRWPEDSEIDRVDAAIPGNWDDAVVTIWPASEDISWPAPFHFNDEGLDLFTRRWATVQLPPSS